MADTTPGLYGHRRLEAIVGPVHQSLLAQGANSGNYYTADGRIYETDEVWRSHRSVRIALFIGLLRPRISSRNSFHFFCGMLSTFSSDCFQQQHAEHFLNCVQQRHAEPSDGS